MEVEASRRDGGSFICSLDQMMRGAGASGSGIDRGGMDARRVRMKCDAKHTGGGWDDIDEGTKTGERAPTHRGELLRGYLCAPCPSTAYPASRAWNPLLLSGTHLSPPAGGRRRFGECKTDPELESQDAEGRRSTIHAVPTRSGRQLLFPLAPATPLLPLAMRCTVSRTSGMRDTVCSSEGSSSLRLHAVRLSNGRLQPQTHRCSAGGRSGLAGRRTRSSNTLGGSGQRRTAWTARHLDGSVHPLFVQHARVSEPLSVHPSPHAGSQDSARAVGSMIQGC